MEEEHGAGLHARRLLARRGELDAAGGDGAQRLDVDLHALEEAPLDVDAAGVPERRALAHEARIALVDEHVDVGREGVRPEVELLHQALRENQQSERFWREHGYSKKHHTGELASPDEQCGLHRLPPTRPAFHAHDSSRVW